MIPAFQRADIEVSRSVLLQKSAYMCRMALGVLWYNSIHEFTIETLIAFRTSLWNSKKMCCMTLGILWTNGENWSKPPPVILRISTEFQGDFRAKKGVIRVNPWVELDQSTPKVMLHILLSSKKISGEVPQFLWRTHA